MKTPLTLLLSAAPLLLAQGKPAEPAKPAAPAEGQVTDAGLIKQIPYRPTLSREPFQTLSDAVKSTDGDLLDDLAVKGQFKRDGKVFAIIADSRGNTRWLPIGYQFKDGEIVAIDDKSVTFNQWDPNSTTKFKRKVVKSFKREEAKR
jgi:hypothetical protein